MKKKEKNTKQFWRILVDAGVSHNKALFWYYYRWDSICRMGMYASNLKLETVKESRKNWNFHFDLQLRPTVLNDTHLYCQSSKL